MPMSRALAKLAVATDLGTAARPSTSGPLAGPVNSSGAPGKAAPAALPSRPLALKPSAPAAWAAVAATPTGPSAAGDGSGHAAAAGGAAPPPPPPCASPRLPPLPSAPQAAAASTSVSGYLPHPAAHAAPPHTLAHLPPRPQSLPPGNASAASGGIGIGAGIGIGIGEELLEAARKHPGLPASLLAQLHAPRRAGSLPSAPPLAPVEPPPGTERPLSARARARVTSAAVAGGARGLASAPQVPLPAAVASLSPAALAVLLAPPQLPAGAGGAGAGVLTMRRAAPVVGSGGAALRPSTASGGSSGPRASPPGSAGAAAAAAGPPPPPRPAVQPHTAVPYKPGSIRLPPGAGPSCSAPGALGPLPPADRPVTAALGAASGAPTTAGGLRPPTANPLTHSLAPDPAASMVVRVPKPGTATSAASAPPPPPAAPGPLAAAPGAGHAGGGGAAKQLTADELRAVVAALAAARPQTAAMLLRRPATTGQQAAAGEAAGGAGARPGTGAAAGAEGSRRPSSARPYSAAGGGGGAGSAARPPAVPAWAGEGEAAARAVRGGAPIPGPVAGPGGPPRSGASTASSTTSRPELRPRSGGVRTVSPPRPGSGGPPGSGGRRSAATGRTTARPALQPIPEDAELSGGAEEAPTLLDALSAAAAPPAAPPPPLEPLESDPVLDAAWEAIVAANKRPDTAALAAPGGSINVFSRPGSSAPSCLRQAAPMVLVLDDIAASTPEVVEHELAHMSLEQLQELRAKLMG